MNEYHKIDTIYKRDPSGKQVLWGQYSRPEFEYLADNRWVFTEKVDGTNIRVMFDPAVPVLGGDHCIPWVTFGGKTDAAQMPAHLVNRLTEMFDAEVMAQVFGGPACLYGEGYGEKIQSGGKYGPVDFALFDVKVGEWWLQRPNVEEIADQLGIRVVPIIGEGTLDELVSRVGAGFQSTWGNFTAEGIVARPKVEMRDRSGRRIITKLKVRDFKP